MSTITEWQGIKFVEGIGKYSLIFAKENKGRNCSVRCCRNPRAEEVYYHKEKLVKFKRKICNKCRSRLYRANNPIKDAYRALRSSAKKRDITFTIAYEDFEMLIKETNYIKEKGNKKGSLHIDRINPELGYCCGNLQVLECSENIAKGNRERFIKRKIFNHEANEDPF